MINKNNKVFLFLSIFIVIILLLAFYLFLSLKSGLPLPEGALLDTDGAVALEMKNNNQEAIQRAKSVSGVNVRKIDDSDYVYISESDATLEFPVEIIVYSDYDDSFSSDFNKNLEKAKKEFAGALKIAYRHFPQRQHANSFTMALAAECAGRQERFLAMHEALFLMKDDDSFDNETLMTKVSALGLDSEAFEKCLTAEADKDKLLKQMAEAKTFSIIGTPTTYVNNILLTGATPWEDFVDSAGYERDGLKSVIENEMNK